MSIVSNLTRLPKRPNPSATCHTTVTTLADIKRERWALWGNCSGMNCGHGCKLDIDALIELFGKNHVFINDTIIPRRLVCRKCGHRGGSCHIVPPSKHTGSL